jgi:hypothetical protein
VGVGLGDGVGVGVGVGLGVVDGGEVGLVTGVVVEDDELIPDMPPPLLLPPHPARDATTSDIKTALVFIAATLATALQLANV